MVNLRVTWSEDEVRLASQLRSSGMTHKEIAKKISEIFGREFTEPAVRSKLNRMKHTTRQQQEKAKFVREVKKNKDGSYQKVDLVELDEKRMKDDEYVLTVMGYDPTKWELIEVKASKWNQHNKIDKTITLYAVNIRVKPLKDLGYFRLLEAVKETKPLEIKTEYKQVGEKWLLEIPFYDTHFGISDYQYYKPTQLETFELIKKRRWEEILILVGSDMFHNDDFRGRTASGRQIQQVDMDVAWEEARKFYEPLISLSLKNSNKVKIIFVKGNHDESMSWAFTQMLKARFPKCEFDDSFEERKVHTFGKNFIGFTHGDKGRKEAHSIFAVEFPKEWARATTREVHMGHFHIEELKDKFGTRVRTLSTRNKTDKWHKDMGYVGGHKEFMVFEYSYDKLRGIYYV